MEEEKVAADKPGISSEESVDGIEGDSNGATEVGCPKIFTSAGIKRFEKLKKTMSFAAAKHESSTTGSDAAEEDKPLKDAAASGAAEEDKPLKDATASGAAGKYKQGQIRALTSIGSHMPIRRQTTTGSGAAEEDKPLKDATASSAAGKYKQGQIRALPSIVLDMPRRRRTLEDATVSGAAEEDKPLPILLEYRFMPHALIWIPLASLLTLSMILIWYMPLLFWEIVCQFSLVTSVFIFVVTSSFLTKVRDDVRLSCFTNCVAVVAVSVSVSVSVSFSVSVQDMANLAIWMFTAQLISHYFVGLLGYALAQHRLLLQTKATDTYKIPTPDNEEEAKRLRVLPMAARLIHALLNLGVALRLWWVLSHSADYTPADLMMQFLLPLIGGLLLWITFIAVALGNAFMGEDGLTLVVFYFFFIMLNYILMVVTLGHTVATLATWFAALGLSGFLGYSIGVYDSLRGSLGIWIHKHRRYSHHI